MKLTSSRARSFAETLWGRGGTTAYRTNRKGAYYFSCSGHGGYIVDSEALTETERASIAPHIKPERAYFASRNGQCYFLQNPFSYRRQRYHIYSDTVTGYADIYIFEEDCNWSILEKFTDIRAEGFMGTQEAREAQTNATFERWICPGTAKQVCSEPSISEQRAMGVET